MRRESGVALLIVLIILFMVTSSSASFIWFMNQQQTRAGARFHSHAALAAAEAGVHRALSILEGMSPDGQAPGRTWRPVGYTESLPGGSSAGRFTVSVADDPDGAIVITSTGEALGATRHVRAHIYLASPCLLAALCGAGAVYLERPPAAMIILPYGGGIGDRPWIHIATGRGIIFAGSDVSINDPSAIFRAGPGPVDAPESASNPTAVRAPGPVRLLLGKDAGLMVGPDRVRVDIQQLRAMGVYAEGVILRTEAMPSLPDVDRQYYQSLAGRNTVNAELNKAAGEYIGDTDLARKRNSLYARTEFERVQRYLRMQRSAGPLRGVIYVMGGGVSLYDGQHLQIVDGTLVGEGSIYLGPATSLEVTHSPATRTLPGLIALEVTHPTPTRTLSGLIALDRGALVVTRDSTLRVHGLVSVAGMVNVGPGGRADIVGAVLARHPNFSFQSLGASTVIRYDPAILGTPGLRVDAKAPVVAWIAAWEELNASR